MIKFYKNDYVDRTLWSCDWGISSYNRHPLKVRSEQMYAPWQIEQQWTCRVVQIDFIKHRDEFCNGINDLHPANTTFCSSIVQPCKLEEQYLVTIPTENASQFLKRCHMRCMMCPFSSKVEQGTQSSLRRYSPHIQEVKDNLSLWKKKLLGTFREVSISMGPMRGFTSLEISSSET